MRGKKHRGEGVGMCLGEGRRVSSPPQDCRSRYTQMWERALRGELDGARALAGVTRRLCYVVVGRFCVAFCSIYVALVFSISFKDSGVLAARSPRTAPAAPPPGRAGVAVGGTGLGL